MLVLARRLHERIILPTLDITIQVVALQGNMVRLGIEAPREVGVYREEVYDPTVVASPADEPPNNLGISVALLQRQLPAGSLSPDARQTLEQVHAQVAALKDQVQALLGRRAQLTS